MKPSTFLRDLLLRGKQVLNVVMIVNEMVDEKRRSGEEATVFKINFEKAYDHVDKGFLDHAPKRKGFGTRWRSWI